MFREASSAGQEFRWRIYAGLYHEIFNEFKNSPASSAMPSNGSTTT